MPETFTNYCTCGGYAWEMNGRPEAQPHMEWCPQFKEYADWFKRQNVKAKQLYTKHSDNDPAIHSNRFPTWDELSEDQRRRWRKNKA